MFKGSIVALVTPMHSNGEIDWDALVRLLDWHIDSGTDAIVIAGTTGESAVLDEAEYQALLETSIAHIAGRCRLIAGCGSPATAFTIKKVQLAKKLGACAALVVTPYYNRPEQSGLVAHYRAISDACDLPLVLYNVPTRTAVDLNIDSVAKLYRRDNIVALKEANAAPGRMTELVSRFGAELDILSGDDATAIESLFAGAVGVISVVNNVAPRAFAQMLALALNGDKQQALAMNARFGPLYLAMELRTNPIPVKWALHKLGKIDTGIRLPLMALDITAQNELEEALLTLNTL